MKECKECTNAIESYSANELCPQCTEYKDRERKKKLATDKCDQIIYYCNNHSEDLVMRDKIIELKKIIESIN